jgi:hypothetical protein
VGGCLICWVSCNSHGFGPVRRRDLGFRRVFLVCEWVGVFGSRFGFFFCEFYCFLLSFFLPFLFYNLVFYYFFSFYLVFYFSLSYFIPVFSSLTYSTYLGIKVLVVVVGEFC